MTENEKTKITELKDNAKESMDMYDQETRSHIERYGNKSCDFLEHRVKMSNYYRGEYNAFLIVLNLDKLLS